MLTDKAILAAKSKARPYKLADGEGLTLLINPNGSKLWRFRYRYEGREKMLALGSYPDTSSKLAREKREQARKTLAQGIDPSNNRKAEKLARGNTFEAIGREWLALQQKTLAILLSKIDSGGNNKSGHSLSARKVDGKKRMRECVSKEH